MNPERAQQLAHRIGKNAKEVPEVLFSLLDHTGKDSPTQKAILSDLAKSNDFPPTPQEFQHYFEQVVKGMQYVHEQFPGQIIGGFQFAAEMRDEHGKLLDPALSYIFAADKLAIHTSMPVLYTTVSRRPNMVMPMPYTEGKVFTPDEVAFLYGIEEAYHSVQIKNKAIFDRLIAEGGGQMVLELFEKDAGAYRTKVAEALKMGIPHQTTRHPG